MSRSAHGVQGKKWFQRTLAVMQQLCVRVLRWEEAAPEKQRNKTKKNTDFMISCDRERLFKPAPVVVENCPSRQREEPLLPFFLSSENLSQHCYSKFNRNTAVSQGVVMVSKCAEVVKA